MTIVDAEPLFEKLIREAQETGEFDDLPGAGLPIQDLDRKYLPGWWARQWIERTRQSEAAIDLAAVIRRRLPRVLAVADSEERRALLDALNREIEDANASLLAADRLERLDVDRILASLERRHS